MKKLRLFNFTFWQVVVGLLVYYTTVKNVFWVSILLSVYAWMFFISAVLVTIKKNQHKMHYDYLKILGRVLQPLEILFSIFYGAVCISWGYPIIGSLLILGNVLSAYVVWSGKKLSLKHNEQNQKLSSI
jgi:hypothetical protein